MKKGEEIILKIEDQLFAGITSHDFDYSRDMIETTDMNTASGTRTYTVGRGGATMSVEGLHKPGESGKDDFFTLLAAAQAGSEVSLYRGSENATEKYLTMQCLISGVSNKSSDNQAANYSCNLQVTGAITISTVSA